MTDKNTILAIVLSAIVLIGWQYFVGMPQLEKQKQEQAQQQAAKNGPAQPGQAANPPVATPGATPAPAQVPGAAPTAEQRVTRAAAIAASPRVAIDTGSIQGSIDLKGARIDDVALVKFRETVDPKSPPIVLLSPSGSPEPFYAEFGWTGSAGTNVKLPTSDTLWTQDGSGALSAGHPVTLTWNNGEGLEFRRTISIDDKYLFTIKEEVANKSANPVTLFPYALISRHGTPPTLGYYILHEGLIGVLGDDGLQEITYKKIEEKKLLNFDVKNAWLGITDKYWAATLVPDTNAHLKAHFSAGKLGTLDTYQTDYLLDAQTIAPGATGSADARLFAGAKEVAVINAYEKQLNLNRFDLLIDWGWFYFITKPLFMVIDWLYHLVGNFGLAILIVTVLIKACLLPARQQVLRLDGEDEGGAAADDRAARALSRRQGQAAAGIDGALQEGEDQSDRRLPAGGDPDSGVLLALQGAVRHHRDAARAVLRLDPRPVGAGSDQHLHAVRPDPVRPDDGAGGRALPASRRLAGDHGHHHVGADEA